ncbi:MAG: ABC transporter ATP-binding protein [Thermoprotei archaeon]|nr:MAG: ABC transporter ATP-binding protein [Thermoprotei archaeon]
MIYAVEAVNLTKYFGSFKAVDGIDLKVRQGEIFGLLGPNGAGKTTTIRMILGLLKPSAGTVKVFGVNVAKNRKEVLKITGYMPQRFSLYEDLTTEENLRLFASLYGLKGRDLDERVGELLDEFQLREYRYRLAGKLSGGTKQRLALAVALVHRPKLLIVDEPTAGVDPPIRRYFWEYFRKLRQEGVTILVTTHYMDEAENCDRLALMNRGRIVARGTPQGIKRLAYGGDIVELYTERRALLYLKSFEGVKTILDEYVKDGVLRVKVLVDDASDRLVPIVKNLEEKGVKVLRANQVFVSLEDAFIKLTVGD